MEGEPILKKTLVTMAAMVSACVVFVGTLSLVAVLVVSHVVGPSSGTDSSPALGSGDKTEAPSSGDRGARSGKPSAAGAKSAHEQI